MPFNLNQFYNVFNAYNTAVGPFVWVFYSIATLTYLLLIKRKIMGSKSAVIFLIALWLWMGVVYHYWFFSRINPMAIVFAAFFVLQSLVLLIGWKRNWLLETITKDSMRIWISSIMIIYSLIAYPVLGLLFGHGYPNGPIFGLPCPTTIFTFALLILMARSSRHLATMALIPFLWSIIGSSAAVAFRVYEDFGLTLSAVATVLIIFKSSKFSKSLD